MRIREFLNNNSAVVTIGAIVLLIVSLAIIIQSNRGRRGGPSVRNLYFYDLNTGKLFPQPIQSIPPVKAPSDDPESDDLSGVQAFVVSCGGCDNVTASDIVWLQMYLPEDKKKMDDMKKAMKDRRGPGAPPSSMAFDTMGMMAMPLIAEAPSAPGKVKWLSSNAPKAMKFRKEAYTKCPDGTLPKGCFPD